MKPYVFVSYRSTQIEGVRKVLRYLADNRVPYWISETDIPPGTTYSREIFEAIKGASALLLLSSYDVVDRPTILGELSLAQKMNVPIFFYQLDDYPIVDDEQYAYYLIISQKANTLEDAVKAIKAKLGPQEKEEKKEWTDGEESLILEGDLVYLEPDYAKGHVLFSLRADKGNVPCIYPYADPDRFPYDFPPFSHVEVKGAFKDVRTAQGLESRLLIKEIVLLPTYPQREDYHYRKRVELFAHTNAYEFEGVASVEGLYALASSMGHPALGICEGFGKTAFPEFHRVFSGGIMKAIYGSQTHFRDGDKVFRAHVLAKNQNGVTALLSLDSLSVPNFRDEFIIFPVLITPYSELGPFRKDLILSSGAADTEVFNEALEGDEETLAKAISRYDLIEVMPLPCYGLPHEKGKEVALRIVKEAKKQGKAIVATSEPRYLEMEDASIYEMSLERVEHETKGFPYLRLGQKRDNHYYSTDEMISSLTEYLTVEEAELFAIVNPQKVARGIEIVHSPLEENPPQHEYGEEFDKELSEKVTLGFQRLYGYKGAPDKRQENTYSFIDSRIKKELGFVFDRDRASMFVYTNRIVDYAKERDEPFFTRGMISSSLLAFLLGLTSSNPLPPHYRCPHCHYAEFPEKSDVEDGFDLPYRKCPKCGKMMIGDGHSLSSEHFYGSLGEKIPSFDFNFGGDFSIELKKAASKVLAPNRVYCLAFINELGIRTLARRYLSKEIDIKDPSVQQKIHKAKGGGAYLSRHPASVMVVPQGVNLARYGVTVELTKNDPHLLVADQFGIRSLLNTFFILGHVNPAYEKYLRLRGIYIGEEDFVNPELLPYLSSIDGLGIQEEDRDYFLNGCLGIAEFERIPKRFPRAKPKTFADLIYLMGVFRANYKNAIETNLDLTTLRKVACGSRDDVYDELLRHGLGPKEAFRISDRIRKGKGDEKAVIATLHHHDVRQESIARFSNASYLPPRSMSVDTAIMGLKLLYAKVYHPLPFYAALFTDFFHRTKYAWALPDRDGLRKRIEEIGEERKVSVNAALANEEKAALFALEMKSRGIEVLVDIHAQGEEIAIDESKNAILLPLSPFFRGQEDHQTFLSKFSSLPQTEEEALRLLKETFAERIAGDFDLDLLKGKLVL